jgi:hypothetical protein
MLKKTKKSYEKQRPRPEYQPTLTVGGLKALGQFIACH